jgi:UDP-N-acetylmuramate dehydrogenase
VSGGKKTAPSLAEVRDAVREIRRRKGMLLVPGDADCRSAGSFFRNPVISEARFQELAARAASASLEIPSYPAPGAHRKVPAAWLVENSGFARGYEQGEAGISHKHALAIINRGEAKASDIVNLKDAIQRAVRQSWAIDLEPEPVFVGF